MSSADYAVLFAVIGIVVLAVIILTAWAIRSDYQLTGSFRLSKRNLPRPPKSPVGIVPPPAGGTEATP